MEILFAVALHPAGGIDAPGFHLSDRVADVVRRQTARETEVEAACEFRRDPPVKRLPGAAVLAGDLGVDNYLVASHLVPVLQHHDSWHLRRDWNSGVDTDDLVDRHTQLFGIANVLGSAELNGIQIECLDMLCYLCLGLVGEEADDLGARFAVVLAEER